MTMEQMRDKADYMLDYALRQGADDVIVNASISRSRQIKFANNGIVITKTWHSEVIGVFLASKRRIVSTVLTNLSRKNIDGSIDNLMRFANSLKPSDDYRGIADGPFKYENIPDSYDKHLLSDGIDYVEGAINAALRHGERTAGVLYMTAAEDYITTSNSVEASDKKTQIEISIRAFDKNASGHGVNCATNLGDFDPAKAGEKAGRIAKQASINPKEGKGGRYDVIFDPLGFANLLGNIMGFASAFSVDIGESFMADKINKKIGNEILTLVDDGSLAGGFNSSRFDAEGVPTRRNVVVENGILRTYMHNTSTARKYKTKTTANAGLVSPRPWNAIIEPGDHTKDELFSGVNNGLYITNLWYTRFRNYRTGDFSTIPRDGLFLIEDGEISQSLKNLRVSDNLQHILENVTALGTNREWIHWWDAGIPSLLPYVLVRDVTITKPEG